VMWFFAVLMVLAIGTVGGVAAGRGEPMVPVDGRHGSGLPDGPVSADDLRRVRFSLAMRGYRMSEVDALLDRLAQEMDRGVGQEKQHGGMAQQPPAGRPAAETGETG
jgi:DivIVA domain-containing protein